MAKAEITKIFYGWKAGDWALCLHCGRVYKIGEFRSIHGLQYCPYPDCDGDAVFDVSHWPRKEDPERNKVYDQSIWGELDLVQIGKHIISSTS